MKRILFAWVGHADLRAMAWGKPKAQKEAILDELKGASRDRVKDGPIRALLNNEKFEEVHLLTNYPRKLNEIYLKWLKIPATVHQAKLDKPTNYPQIFEAANGVLVKIMEGRDRSEWELCIHLSPGTPAMTAIWVLLGRSRFPATFYQTYSDKAWVTDVPFDIVDFVPELLNDSEARLQHLIASSPQEIEGFKDIIGTSRSIRLAVGRASRAAMGEVPVFILGESGTGKDMFAQAIHAHSSRREKPFIPINCASIPESLFESELFGHKKGAFTGAAADRAGAFEMADGGTLFLDEVGESPKEMQAKLLRVLQPPHGKPLCHRSFNRVGESTERTSDVRIIAATNREDIFKEIEEGRFREDLYHRLAVIVLRLPPLRELRSDIISLAEHLLGKLNKQDLGFGHKKLSANAKTFVKKQSWRGNVRQLNNVLIQASLMADGDTLHQSDIRAAIEDAPHRSKEVHEHQLGEGFSLDDLLEEIQRVYLQRAMEESDGKITGASKLLGYPNYQRLDQQLIKFGLTNLKSSGKSDA